MMIHIEIAYAKPEEQWQIPLSIPAGSTIHQALKAANFFTKFPEFTEETIDLGIWGKPKCLSDVLRPNDRIEIYRPLICDPKKARRDKV